MIARFDLVLPDVTGQTDATVQTSVSGHARAVREHRAPTRRGAVGSTPRTSDVPDRVFVRSYRTSTAGGPRPAESRSTRTVARTYRAPELRRRRTSAIRARIVADVALELADGTRLASVCVGHVEPGQALATDDVRCAFVGH